MSERYQELYRTNPNIYTPGCPLIIEVGVLQKDTTINRVLAQIKFMNISERYIQVCKVHIKAYEINGNELEGIDSYSYLDLNVAPGGEFGSKTPVYLPNAFTRKIELSVTEVIFTDGNKWNMNLSDLKQLPIQKVVSENCIDTEGQKKIIESVESCSENRHTKIKKGPTKNKKIKIILAIIVALLVIGVTMPIVAYKLIQKKQTEEIVSLVEDSFYNRIYINANNDELKLAEIQINELQTYRDSSKVLLIDKKLQNIYDELLCDLNNEIIYMEELENVGYSLELEDAFTNLYATKSDIMDLCVILVNDYGMCKDNEQLSRRILQNQKYFEAYKLAWSDIVDTRKDTLLNSSFEVHNKTNYTVKYIVTMNYLSYKKEADMYEYVVLPGEEKTITLLFPTVREDVVLFVDIDDFRINNELDSNQIVGDNSNDSLPAGNEQNASNCEKLGHTTEWGTCARCGEQVMSDRVKKFITTLTKDIPEIDTSYSSYIGIDNNMVYNYCDETYSDIQESRKFYKKLVDNYGDIKELSKIINAIQDVLDVDVNKPSHDPQSVYDFTDEVIEYLEKEQNVTDVMIKVIDSNK